MGLVEILLAIKGMYINNKATDYEVENRSYLIDSLCLSLNGGTN